MQLSRSHAAAPLLRVSASSVDEAEDTLSPKRGAECDVPLSECPLSEVKMLEEERAQCEQLAKRLRELHPQEQSLRFRPLGLAFSGGGTRCASFHCGVLWALAGAGLVKDVAHLSATSGGGYTAGSFMTHLFQMAGDAEGMPSLDEWYRTVVMRTTLRMQHNINYLVQRDASRCFRLPTDGVDEEEGSSTLPRICDLPLMIVCMSIGMGLSPVLLFMNIVWPIVSSISIHHGHLLRRAWCDPSTSPESNSILLKWFYARMFSASIFTFAAILLNLCCKYDKHMQKTAPSRYLLWRAVRQLIERGVICYAIYTLLVLWVLWLQTIGWGSAAASGHSQHSPEVSWVRHLCHQYATAALSAHDGDSNDILHAPVCFDQPQGGYFWFQKGDNTLYLNASWASVHAVQPSNAVWGHPLAFDHSQMVLLTAEVTSLGVTGLVTIGVVALIIGSALLKYLLTIMGPAFLFYVICSVARWQVFGPITGQLLFGYAGTNYQQSLATYMILFCVVGVICTLPFYDAVQKILHLLYRRALKKAFFFKGKDVSDAALVTCPYCPNLLFGACLHDYRPPGEDSNFCDFTISSFFLGSSRTGYYYTPSQARLAHLMTVTGAGPDAALLVNLDTVLIRFVLAVLSLRFGDFLRLQPDGETAVRVSEKIKSKVAKVGNAIAKVGSKGPVPTHCSAFAKGRTMSRYKKYILDHDHHWVQRWLQGLFDRLPAAFPFLVCHSLLLLGTFEANSRRCRNAWLLLVTSYMGFLTILALSFFAFLRPLNWMMRSPMILQFQMTVMNRYKAVDAPPYVYLSDGGLLEVLNLLPLLRRRMRHMIVSDGAEDANLTMRCLRETSTIARQEGLCSFFDPKDPRRDLEFIWQDLVKNQTAFLHLCVRYEPVCNENGDAVPHSSDEVEIGHVYYIRMRGHPEDMSHVRTLLTKEDLLNPPVPAAHAPAEPGYGLRKNLGGACFPFCECGGLCAGRRFPDFSHHNQFLTPLHFANLCTLGAELTKPVVEALSVDSQNGV